MRHWYTTEPSSGEHYAASINGNETAVLLQVGDRYANQARAQLTASDARHCAALLLEAATLLDAAKAKSKPIDVPHTREPRDEEIDWANAGEAYSDADPGL
jgi:hypothetical protein